MDSRLSPKTPPDFDPLHLSVTALTYCIGVALTTHTTYPYRSALGSFHPCLSTPVSLTQAVFTTSWFLFFRLYFADPAKFRLLSRPHPVWPYPVGLHTTFITSVIRLGLSLHSIPDFFVCTLRSFVPANRNFPLTILLPGLLP